MTKFDLPTLDIQHPKISLPFLEIHRPKINVGKHGPKILYDLILMEIYHHYRCKIRYSVDININAPKKYLFLKLILIIFGLDIS